MRTVDYGLDSGLRQKLANAKGRISTQFMSGDLQKKDNLSGKRAIEESVKMEGYEINVKKKAATRTETQQPMTGHSEFWIS